MVPHFNAEERKKLHAEPESNAGAGWGPRLIAKGRPDDDAPAEIDRFTDKDGDPTPLDFE